MFYLFMYFTLLVQKVLTKRKKKILENIVQ